MMECDLWLLRHARAELDSPDGQDRSRILHASGRHACTNLNRWLLASRELKLPDQVLVSPSARTRETAELALRDLALPVRIDPRLWLASAGELLDLADKACKRHSSLMLIGHNPGLEELIRHLGGTLPATGLKPGTLAVLRLTRPLGASRGQMLQLLEANESS